MVLRLWTRSILVSSSLQEGKLVQKILQGLLDGDRLNLSFYWRNRIRMYWIDKKIVHISPKENNSKRTSQHLYTKPQFTKKRSHKSKSLKLMMDHHQTWAQVHNSIQLIFKWSLANLATRRIQWIELKINMRCHKCPSNKRHLLPISHQRKLVGVQERVRKVKHKKYWLRKKLSNSKSRCKLTWLMNSNS
jgi:hypothetical protein